MKTGMTAHSVSRTRIAPGAAACVIFAGTLAEMTDAGWVPLGRMVNTGDTRTYRVRIELQDVDDALGQTARVEFLWEATPA